MNFEIINKTVAHCAFYGIMYLKNTSEGKINMGFKRAQWHSGLTYQQTCDQCHTLVQYMDDKLDFRPWYADGFVYCPKCKKPLRHNESYAINAAPDTDNPQPVDISSGDGAFCVQCGKKFNDGDRFCAGCGAKRV